MSVVAGRTSRSFCYTLLDGGEIADGVDHHVVHARGEVGISEGYDAGGRQHRLETLRGAGPPAGALDDLAQPTAARVHRLHRCLWLLVTWSWIGVSSVARDLGVDGLEWWGAFII